MRKATEALQLDPNPPHGEKGDFRKVTITLPPKAFEQLVQEAAKRKIAGKPNRAVSAIVREAVVKYLGHQKLAS